jgi:hypothetical protein
MNDQPPVGKPEPKPAAATTETVPATAAEKPATPASALTPEEQMAAFEKDLKENDWGHQPC